MDDGAIFSSLACDELEAHLALLVVCGNAGVNNYGTDNMRARLRYDREIVGRADIVVVTIVAEDTRRGLSDLESRYFYSSIPPGPLPAIGEALGFALYKASWGIRHHDLRYDDSYEVEVGLASLNLLLDELVEMRSAGKKVLLVFSPTLRDLEEKPPELNRALRGRIARSDVPSLDLVDLVRNLNVSKGVPAIDLYQDGMHLTATGHRFYGGWIGATLVAELSSALPKVVRKIDENNAKGRHRLIVPTPDATTGPPCVSSINNDIAEEGGRLAEAFSPGIPWGSYPP
jgi:hypothetical protein